MLALRNTRVLTSSALRRSAFSTNSDLTFSKYPFLAELGFTADNKGVFDGEKWCGDGEVITSYNPTTKEPIARIQFGTPNDYNRCVENMKKVENKWQRTPAPVRGEIVREIGQLFRERKDALGSLLSLEMGKIKPEGDGEVQEVIDMCDLAVGMSRQLPGQWLPSERTDHVLLETWNPLGAIGIITAYNFPCAVTGWNASVSLVCGNTQLYKGAPSTSLVAIATQKIFTEVLEKHGLGAVATLCQGGGEIGEEMINDDRLSLISFTGSTKVGRHVAKTVAGRFGTSILELGGNNAVVVMDDADLDMALPTIMFAAAGTAGQRCTTLRRLVVHEKIYDEFVSRLVNAYKQLKPGDPLEKDTLLGPLHNEAAVKTFTDGIAEMKAQGGKVLVGGTTIDGTTGHYVWPTLVESNVDMPIVKEELFVPITHILKCSSLDEAIAINNSVEQGLSSSLLTKNMQNVFKWVGPEGSDCGIINVNTSCSGAEIGGGFGGNKSTGNGRESGSDSWKQYMRRGTCAINFGTDLPLAQGLKFT
jgi:aldehyde dehydrogenase family 7 protein A1